MSEPAHARDLSRHNNGTILTLLCTALVVVFGVAFPQEKLDLDAADRMRDAALNHSAQNERESGEVPGNRSRTSRILVSEPQGLKDDC